MQTYYICGYIGYYPNPLILNLAIIYINVIME